VIKVETAEADDVIGTLVKHNHDEPLLILSGDKDFIQLHKYPKVKQYDPVHKRWLGDKNPKRYLIEHIAKGDRGDGIPNFISPDTCFVNGIRQKPLRAKYLDNLKGDNIDNVQQAFEDEELKRGWIRNRLIIDLDHIPEGIEEQILSKFNTPQKGRDKMFNYFITHKLKHLMEDISEF
jgi:5'-3' exonuclease